MMKPTFNIIRNERKVCGPIIYTDTLKYIHRNHNNAYNNKVYSSIAETFFALRVVCVCVYVKRQEWFLLQRVMVFTLNIYISKNGTTKIKEKRKRRYYVGMDL